MSEYEEMAEALRSAYRRQELFEQEGRDFAESVIRGLSKYLGAPPERFNFFRCDETQDSNPRPLPSAVELVPGGTFQMMIKLDLPSGGISFPLKFKKNPDASWSVSLGRGVAPQRIDPRMEGHYQELAIEFARVAKTAMRDSLDAFLSGSDRAPIGFK